MTLPMLGVVPSGAVRLVNLRAGSLDLIERMAAGHEDREGRSRAAPYPDVAG